MTSEFSFDSDPEMPSMEFLMDELETKLAASMRSVRLAAVPRNLEISSFEIDPFPKPARLSQPIVSSDTLDQPCLPPEIWIGIINQLRSPNTSWFRSPSIPKQPDIKSLIPLLTVSKTISVIAEPFLYEWVVLSIDKASESRRHRLLTTLAARPHTLGSVKYLVVQEAWGLSNDELRASTINAIGLWFPALKSLRGISMGSTLVPAYMTTNLRLFQRLEVFEFLGAVLEIPAGHAVGNGFPSIRHVTLHGHRPEHLTESDTRLTTLFLGTFIETLHVSPDFIHVFLASLTPGSTIVLDRLQTLYTDMLRGSSSYLELFELLQHCPSITTLSVSRDPFDRWAKQLIPPVTEVARHLQTLEAPSDLANLLVPGRPIRSLTLRNHGSLNGPALEWFAQSTAPLTYLSLQVLAEGTLGNISRIFPTLEELHFCFCGANTYEKWPVEQLAPLRNLRALSFRRSVWFENPLFAGSDSIAVTSTMLKILHENHPSLVSVVLSDDSPLITVTCHGRRM